MFHYGVSERIRIKTALASVSAVLLLVLDLQFEMMTQARAYLYSITSPIQIVSAHISLQSQTLQQWLLNQETQEETQAQLESENRMLKAQLLQFNYLKRENEELRALLNVSPSQFVTRYRLAQITSLSQGKGQQVTQINKGFQHKIQVGDTVVDTQGLIGQISQTSAFNSEVLLITDPKQMIPVINQRNGLRGVIQGNLQNLKLRFIPQGSDIQVGDSLLTSGLGQHFPEGYPVATVEQIENKYNADFLSIQAKPIAQLHQSSYVLILEQGQSHE